jgi:diguanylate cyclase (GGDEF)-like protein
MPDIALAAFVVFLVFLVFAALGFTLQARAETPPASLAPEDAAWVEAHRNQTFTVGFDPYAGMDVFDFRGVRTGFLPALIDDMQKTLGLRLVLARVNGWDDAYRRFVAGRIDILYGANPTPEREKIMVFTRPALRYPYVVFARKDSSIQTLGDLDSKRVAFIANDFVSQQMPREYPNIGYRALYFGDQKQALQALVSGRADGFVNAGGGVEHEFLFNYPDLTMIAELPSITSDMTFAVRRADEPLVRIIDRYIERRSAQIAAMASDAERTYNRKILRLTDAELNWLEQKGEAVVGVADDYLPFDLYQDGQYKGIAGETLKGISDIIGIRFKVVHGPFAEIYEKARTGSIDVVNIAKTDDRLQYFLYPRPISNERDIIVGRKSSPPVHDVYGLEGARVAVINGFWHEEYLRKNLKRVNVVKTADIMESLRRVDQGEADYLIENPTVAEFYIHGLGYNDLVKRGNTSKDSFVYFGVNRGQPELAAIMDKALTLINFEDMKYAGIQSVPALQNVQNRRLAAIAVGLAVALLAIMLVTIRIVRSLSAQKAKTQFLQEREHFLYTDPLTGFHNRNYFSRESAVLKKGDYPQAIVVADLNNLKLINDQHGHGRGDELLIRFAELMRELFPGGKHFRIGGDEFLTVMDRISEEDVVRAIGLLRERAGDAAPAAAGDAPLQPSAAVGYAVRYSDEQSLDECIRMADERMYRVKASMKKRRTDQDD